MEVKIVKSKTFLKAVSFFLCIIILYCLLSADFTAYAGEINQTGQSARISNESYRQSLEEKYGYKIIISDSVKEKDAFYIPPKVVNDAELQILKDIESAFAMLPDEFVKEVSEYFVDCGYSPSVTVRKLNDSEKADPYMHSYAGWFEKDNAAVVIVAGGNELPAVLLHEFGHMVAYALTLKDGKDEKEAKDGGDKTGNLKNLNDYFTIQNKDYLYHDDINYIAQKKGDKINPNFYDYYISEDCAANFGEDFAHTFAYSVMQSRYLSSYGSGAVKPVHNKIRKLAEVLRSAFSSLQGIDFLMNCLPDKPAQWAEQAVKQAKAKNIIPWNIYGLNKAALRKYDAALIMKQFLHNYMTEDELFKKAGISKDAEIPRDFVYDLPDGKDVLLVNNLDIVTVGEDGRFNPNMKVERQYAAKILANTARLLGVSADENSLSYMTAAMSRYNDYTEIAGWADNYIKFVTYLKIMQGDDKNNFYPGRYITYQELYAALLKLDVLIEERNTQNTKNNITPPAPQILGAGSIISENGWICYSPVTSAFVLSKFTGGAKMIYDEYTYEGFWKDGQWDVRGKIIWQTGGVYEGGFDKGKITGQGKIIWADGEIYEGDFIDSRLTGRGKMTYKDKTVYEGGWDNGVWNGFGKVVWSDGTVYEGSFKNNVYDGKGKMTWKNGSWFEGEWKNGIRAGGRYFAPDGKIYNI